MKYLPNAFSSSCDVKHVILSLTVYVKVYILWQTYSREIMYGSVRACRDSEIKLIINKP